MLRKVDVRTRSNRPNESVKQISIRSFLDTWEQFPRMETRFDDIQEEEWDRWRCLLRPDIISCRGYYRRRARKSTWRRTKGTLNALVTSTPRRRGVFTLPFFSSPSEYRTRSIERKKKVGEKKIQNWRGSRGISPRNIANIQIFRGQHEILIFLWKNAPLTFCTPSLFRSKQQFKIRSMEFLTANL